jgi:hypothetical protein
VEQVARAQAPSLYSDPIGALETISLGLGLGIAIGLAAGATGVEGSARGRMALLTAAVGLLVGYLATSALGGEVALGALFTGFAAGFGCAVFSDVRAGANRKGATAALGVAFVFVALVIAGLSLLFHYLGLIVFLAVVWLAIVRSRRRPDRHAGLRVLR